MTAIERLKRKRARQRPVFEKTLRKSINAFRSARVRLRFQGQRSPRSARGEYARGSIEEPLEPPVVDSLIVRAMKKQVLDLIDDGNGSCGVSDMAHAILNTRYIFDLHAQDEYGDSLPSPTSSPLSSSWLRSTDAMIRFLKRQSARQKFRSDRGDARIRRRYELMHALQELEQRPSSHEARITTWDEAETELRTVLTFPPNEDAGGETAPSTDRRDGDEDDHIASYLKRCAEVRERRVAPDLVPSRDKWRRVIDFPVRGGEADEADGLLEARLSDALRERDERLKSKTEASDKYEALLLQKEEEEEERKKAEIKREQDEKAKKRAESLMRPLTIEERKAVSNELEKIGNPNEIVRQVGPDSIQRENLQTLRPGQWLNDEVIHYFYVMLSKRDEEMCQSDSARKRSHFFKSFFMTKLLDEGNLDPSLNGKYNYSNVKRWSKKVPGKDIFNLDKIFFPINQGQMHWVCAVAFMQKRRIQFYDSMGDGGLHYLEALLQYIKDEHKDKKKSPLPDADEWELVPCTDDTPRQLNGFDCGVFTCMFADFIAKNCPLVFEQSHVSQCRERIALSILNGRAIM